MAMIDCSECGAKISSEAKQCPKCGIRIKKKISRLGYLARIVIVLVVAIFAIDLVNLLTR